jgi:glycosyltransferase involved in cell wall biosynthesis
MVVLFAGKLQSKKNPVLLLETFRELGSSAHLVFVGNGELEGELRQRAGSMQNVHFMPFQNQSAMPAVYRLGDLFVLPSQGPEETWGLALNEAMASGRAVIASTRVGGACDLVQSERNGWVFESGDGSTLLKILNEAIGMGRLALASMGECAQLHSCRFSTEESAARIAAAARQMFGSGPADSAARTDASIA